MDASEVKALLEKYELKLDGISAHCPFWIQTTAWTGSKTMAPFLSPEVAKKSPSEIERWAEDYVLALLDLAAELGVKVMPMFWGVAFGWEVATGYPWGFWKGPGYDLIEEGGERFVSKTQKIRDRARGLGIKLCHEVHPGTAAVCARDFLALRKMAGDDECVVVIADPSHCWEGESWETRFRILAELVYACHMKNHYVAPGMPMRCMEPDWQKRPMRFEPLERGEIDLVAFTKLLIEIGYPQRYRETMGLEEGVTAPLVSEAEAAYEDLDETAESAVEFINCECCFEVAEQSFEDGMGETSDD